MSICRICGRREGSDDFEDLCDACAAEDEQLLVDLTVDEE